MPLRIAFDLDGVLADMESELDRHAQSLFGSAASRTDRSFPPDVPAGGEDGGDAVPENTPPLVRLKLTPRQQRRLWKHVVAIDDFWGTLDETEPGIVARLAATAAERRWEIIFLTKRPESAGATAQVQSQRWLASRGFPLPSVFVVQGSRGRIAAALDLDVVIDDRPENCVDVVVDSQARAILVWRDENRPLPIAARRLGIGLVTSVAECLDILADIDSKHQRDRPGVMERVLRRLGLKEREPAQARSPSGRISKS